MQQGLERSAAAFAKAQELMPGGVNSPVRAFQSVGGTPIFLRKGVGSRVYDIDDNVYIDYVGSWGPLILGHAHSRVVEAICAAAAQGTSFGAPTEWESRLAALLIEALPSLEVVRMVNSGTEATMSALRLARGFTGREKILKLEGCYHGHMDSLLIKAGSGIATLGLPDSPGVTPATAEQTLTVPYNDVQKVREVFQHFGEELAAVIVEPVAGNMGLVPPQPEFLETLRELTSHYGALLIFDEVMTGFRVGYQGAQGRFGVTPDLTCLGKVIGGGLPVGAYGGRREIMEMMAPQGPIYQAGTLSGNPLAMSAGYATLQELGEPGVFEELEKTGSFLAHELQLTAERLGVPLQVPHIGAMLGVFFSDREVTSFTEAKATDTERYKRYFHAMLREGVYLPPSPFEALFLSTAHGEEEIDLTLTAHRRALEAVLATNLKD